MVILKKPTLVSFLFRFLYSTSHLAGPLVRKRMAEQRTSSGSVQEHFSWMNKLAPCFRVNGRQVEIIRDPSVFYSTLMVNFSCCCYNYLIAQF